MRHAVLAAALLLGALLTPCVVSASMANDVCAPSADPCVVSSPRIILPGSTLDFGTRQLDVTPTGSLTVNVGKMTILAGSVRLESHGALIGAPSGTTGASIAVTTSGDIRVENGASGPASIGVSGSAPGQIDLVAHGSVVVAGQVTANGSGNASDGGIINVTADSGINVTGSWSSSPDPIAAGTAAGSSGWSRSRRSAASRRPRSPASTAIPPVTPTGRPTGSAPSTSAPA